MKYTLVLAILTSLTQLPATLAAPLDIAGNVNAFIGQGNQHRGGRAGAVDTPNVEDALSGLTLKARTDIFGSASAVIRTGNSHRGKVAPGEDSPLSSLGGITDSLAGLTARDINIADIPVFVPTTTPSTTPETTDIPTTFDAIEPQIQDIVSQLNAQDIDAKRAHGLLLLLIAKLDILGLHLGHLSPSNLDLILGSLDKHGLGIRVNALITLVLGCVNDLVVKLHLKLHVRDVATPDVSDFSDVVGKLGGSVQGVIDVCVRLVPGLDVILAGLLGPILPIAAHVGVHLHVGGLGL